MLIKATYMVTEGDVRVDFSFGERAPQGPSYTMVNRGALVMKKEEWAALSEILSRGAKRPTMVVIEQSEV